MEAYFRICGNRRNGAAYGACAIDARARRMPDKGRHSRREIEKTYYLV